MMRGAGRWIGQKAEDVCRERAQRLNNPAFQAELAQSRTEIVNHLTNFGSSALDAAYRLCLRAPAAASWFAVRGIFDKNVTGGQMMTRAFDEFGEGFSSAGQAILHGIRFTGRTGLHTLRWLVAK